MSRSRHKYNKPSVLILTANLVYFIKIFEFSFMQKSKRDSSTNFRTFSLEDAKMNKMRVIFHFIPREVVLCL